MVAKIFLIESGRVNTQSFAPALEKKGYSVTVHHKLNNALEASKKKKPDFVVLDAASMRTSGTRMCRNLRTAMPKVPVILVAPAGSDEDASSGASLTLVHPFTSRKLINRITRMLPGDESYVLEVAPIKLNLAQRKVFSAGKETRLTPKQSKLLEVFLLNPNRLLTRKALIRLVWHTDYTGDTRTLDVHMSWLRQAVEKDPSSPVLLKTIRGMGYRFDPAE
jgi:DNA-binding response OmpR family regulator